MTEIILGFLNLFYFSIPFELLLFKKSKIYANPVRYHKKKLFFIKNGFISSKDGFWAVHLNPVELIIDVLIEYSGENSGYDGIYSINVYFFNTLDQFKIGINI